MNVQLVLVLTFALLSAGCQTAPNKEYDAGSFKVEASKGMTIKTKLTSGLTKIGHSDWISAVDYAAGKNPSYYCTKGDRHSWLGQYWMFLLSDQKKFVSNLNKVLNSNGTYSASSKNTLEVVFNKVAQGPSDSSVYTFEITLNYYSNAVLTHTSHHKFKGNDAAEEFWDSGSWDSSKSRASNRLMAVVIKDLNKWLNSTQGSI